jgi:hypothetical protein
VLADPRISSPLKGSQSRWVALLKIRRERSTERIRGDGVAKERALMDGHEHEGEINIELL